MKTIGMIGGMSWESSLEYYRIINEAVKELLGDLHSAKSLMYSVDFAEIEVLQREGRWQDATRAMIQAARAVEAGGADFLIICTNTMHKMADEVQKSISIPLLHIADATAEAIQAQGLLRVGLLGTQFTMEQDFYRGRLVEKYALDVLIPDRADREIVHRVIYNELVLGKIVPDSKAEYLRIISALAKAGAEGIILGCTEIGLLVSQADSTLPLFDTTRIHALAAVRYALQDKILPV
ncbi:MAG: aspartate/glutamate racemase family protein [Anaerolineales bacterium]|jgi:aspartate racemase